MIHKGEVVLLCFPQLLKTLVRRFVCQSENSPLLIETETVWKLWFCSVPPPGCKGQSDKEIVKVKVNHKLMKTCFSGAAVAAVVSICFAPPQSDSLAKVKADTWPLQQGHGRGWMGGW